MTRYSHFFRARFAPALALAATLGAVACTVQKTESSAAKDTATVSIPATAPPAVTPPATSTGGAAVEDSSKAGRKPAPKPAVKTPAAGGERDSATQAVFEIGPDGKIRRVKR
jgi:ABC-type transport system substrate-binding protein